MSVVYEAHRAASSEFESRAPVSTTGTGFEVVRVRQLSTIVRSKLVNWRTSGCVEAAADGSHHSHYSGLCCSSA